MWLTQTKFYQKRPKMKILTKIYQLNLNCRTESIAIVNSKHETLSSDSIEKKVITIEFTLQLDIISR